MIAPTQQQQRLSLAQAPIPQVDQDRKRAMREAWKAYRGEFSKPLKIDKDQPDDNVQPNPCATIVEKGVSYLCNKPVKIEASDETSKANSPIQDFLNGLWGDDDDKMSLLTEIATNGGVCGQTFVKLIPAKQGMKYPRMVNLDPMLIRKVVDPEDCEIILAFILEYPISGGMQKRQIIARIDPGSSVELWGNNDPDDTWTITNYQRRALGGPQDTWQQVGEPQDWLYPFPPIFTNKNLPNPNESWGGTDLPPEIIALAKSLQFTMSNTSRIIKYHAHPKTVATGVVSTQISVSVDDVLCLPSPDSTVKNLEMQSNLQSSRDHASDIQTYIDVQSRVPAIARGVNEPRGNISGVALTVYYQPILEKTTEKQRLYGRLIREISRAALVLSGLIPVEQFEDYKIGLHWQPLLPVDDLAAAQEALVLKQLGISDATIQQGLGYDPDDEAEKSTQEDAKKLTNFSRGQGMPPAPSASPGQPPQQQGMAQSAQGQQGKAGIGQ